MKNFIPYFHKVRYLIIWQFILSIIAVFIAAITPTYYSSIVDNCFNSNNKDFVPLFIIVSLLFLARYLILLIRGLIDPKVTFITYSEIQKKVMSKVYELSFKDILKKKTGDLISNVSRDANAVTNFISNYIFFMFSYALQFIFVLILMFRKNVSITLLLLIPIPLVSFLSYILMNKARTKFLKNWQRSSEQNSFLHDFISGIFLVKIFHKEEELTTKFINNNNALKESQIDSSMFWVTYNPILNFLISFLQVFTYYLVGNKVLANYMSIGDLLLFTSYVGMLYSSLNAFINVPRVYSNAIISANKLNELFNIDTSKINKEICPKLEGEVSFNNVSFSYEVGKNTLSNISFKVKKGQMVGIVGYSGSGKSTLVSLLMKFYDVDSGCIMVDNKNIKDLDETSFRKNIGIVMQDTMLKRGTILENLKYGNENASFEEVIKAAKLANAHQFIIKKEMGYETILGHLGEGLSGGQKQRISIARALLTNPSILIFDEATSSLDSKTEDEILKEIKDICKDKTTFMIAHRLATLKDADFLLVLNKGKLVEIGTHEELVLKDGYYASLVKAQLLNYEKDYQTCLSK